MNIVEHKFKMSKKIEINFKIKTKNTRQNLLYSFHDQLMSFMRFKKYDINEMARMSS